MHKCRQTDQPQPRQMPQPSFSLRRPVRPLATSLQMMDQTALNMALDLAVGADGIPEGKVVRPTFQVPIQLSNQDWNRLEAPVTIGHLVQLRPLPLDGFLRREHIQVFLAASFPIAVVSKRVSQKVQTGPFLSQIHHSRLFPVDLQLELSFQPRFDKLDGLRSHLFRQRHERTSWTSALRAGPCGP